LGGRGQRHGVWQQNLDAVTSTLDRAGIDHFYVRPVDEAHSVVAVRQRDRASTVSVLHEAPALAGARILLGEVTEAARSTMLSRD
jgi:hypothetical protein